MSQHNLSDYKKELLKIKMKKGVASGGKAVTYFGAIASLFIFSVLIISKLHGSELSTEDWLMLICPVGVFVIGISIWGIYSLCDILLLIINEIEANKNDKQEQSGCNQNVKQSRGS